MNVFFFYFFFHKNLLGRLAKLNFLKKQKTSLIWHTRNPAITQNAFPFFGSTEFECRSLITQCIQYVILYLFIFIKFINIIKRCSNQIICDISTETWWQRRKLFEPHKCCFQWFVVFLIVMCWKRLFRIYFFLETNNHYSKKKCYCFVYSVTSFFMPNWCFHVPDKRNNFTHSMLLWATCYFISFLLLFFLLISRTKTGECFI